MELKYNPKQPIQWFLDRVGFMIIAASPQGYNGEMQITDEEHAQYLFSLQDDIELLSGYYRFSEINKPIPPVLNDLPWEQGVQQDGVVVTDVDQTFTHTVEVEQEAIETIVVEQPVVEAIVVEQPAVVQKNESQLTSEKRPALAPDKNGDSEFRPEVIRAENTLIASKDATPESSREYSKVVGSTTAYGGFFHLVYYDPQFFHTNGMGLKVWSNKTHFEIWTFGGAELYKKGK